MSEYFFPSVVAHRTPTSYSDDVRSPFKNLGMGEWSDDELYKYFEHGSVLDIGSGFEGIARRLYQMFESDDPAKPVVVNLNPQFTDWRRDGNNLKRLKSLDLLSCMREIMDMDRGDYRGYVAQRVAIAGVAQHLPFRANSFNRIVSTWAFPNCLYDCSGGDIAHDLGYAEILRVLQEDGEARLAPIGYKHEEAHSIERLETVQNVGRFTFGFTDGNEGQVIVINK